MRSLPIACELGAFPTKADFNAHLAEGRRFLVAALERRELPNGWALRLPSEDGTVLAVARWTVEDPGRPDLFDGAGQPLVHKCLAAKGNSLRRRSAQDPDVALKVAESRYHRDPHRHSV
jgi:hypothetical protein